MIVKKPTKTTTLSAIPEPRFLLALIDEVDIADTVDVGAGTFITSSSSVNDDDDDEPKMSRSCIERRRERVDESSTGVVVDDESLRIEPLRVDVKSDDVTVLPSVNRCEDDDAAIIDDTLIGVMPQSSSALRRPIDIGASSLKSLIRSSGCGCNELRRC